jgi:D-ribose pyranose/furanose isomerase RbsD
MKIWEKVNNITGNDSKSRYLIPYINAGSKFLLSALPEKFLWTIASESEIEGWDSGGDSQIGAGSAIAYDKVLAVYRLDSGKKRLCSEAPDNNIHIFDEASSLLSATEMFPKFYKLSGKIYIKPDPDYNSSSSTKSYTPLGGSSTDVAASAGDKGVIVYSAPPIVDENTDSWILAEYENIVLFYAASLDHFRLASVYRDLCKTQVDVVASGSLNFSVTSSIPDSISLTKSLPVFSFSSSLPSDFNITKSLPDDFSISTPLPFFGALSVDLPSSFSAPSAISSPDELSHTIDVSSITDALTKAQELIDGSVTTNNAQEWLNDEDAEMSGSTVEVASSEVRRAQGEIAKEKTKLEDFSSKVNQRLTKYTSDVGNYTQQVQKESTRITSDLAKYQREIERATQKFQSDVAEYQAELAKESARSKVDITHYTSEIAKEKSRIESSLARYSAELSQVVQSFTTELQVYQAEVAKENQRISSDVSKYQAEVAKSSKDLEKEMQQYSLDMQAAQMYAQKSAQSIQTSGQYYQRAINELGAITGAITAPEQQQTSQRREQGATS